MSEVKDWDRIEAFQLKECYDLAATYETVEKAKAVLKSRSEEIMLPGNYVPLQENVAYRETEMQIISEALYDLSLERFGRSGSFEFELQYKINALPDSGDKEMVLALIQLRNGTSESSRSAAMRHIREALRFSPGNPIYSVIADILLDAGK